MSITCYTSNMSALKSNGSAKRVEPVQLVRISSLSSPVWSPVQVETLSWRIVSQVRAALFSGQLKSGDLLGSESSIAQQFQVSRMAARDALRSLEAVGIVEIRMGIKGGAWIAQGNVNRFADALSIQLQLIGVTADEIFNTQLAIDPVAAGLAATLASPDDITRLREAAAECQRHLDDPDAFTAASINFHELVIECSRNRVLLAQFRALRSVLQPLVRPKTTTKIMSRLTRSNDALLNALSDHDATEAANLMRERVSAVRVSVLNETITDIHERATINT